MVVRQCGYIYCGAEADAPGVRPCNWTIVSILRSFVAGLCYYVDIYFGAGADAPGVRPYNWTIVNVLVCFVAGLCQYVDIYF